MKKIKILNLSIIITLTYLLYYSRSIFAQTQTFDDNFIPQTIISSPKLSNQCFKFTNFAFYDGQFANFYSTFSANSIWNTIRIINTATGQNGTYYYAGAPDSSKEFIYNPFGSLSSSKSFVEKNSFVPNFVRKSIIKPANIQSVYVVRQNSSTYFIGWSGSFRWELAGQVVHNIWRRAPYNITNWWLNYSYVEYPSQTVWTKQLTLSRSNGGWRDRTDNNEYLCNNIYVARCGDTIVDNTTKAGWNNTDWKQWIQTYANKSWTQPSNWFIPWTFSGSFKGEICDSHNLTWDACVNWTLGCCNTTCDWYVWTWASNERCGDEVLQIAGNFYNGDQNNMSFEECDDWDIESDTDGLVNGDDPNSNFCTSLCLPAFTEAFVEVFINW